MNYASDFANKKRHGGNVECKMADCQFEPLQKKRKVEWKYVIAIVKVKKLKYYSLLLFLPTKAGVLNSKWLGAAWEERYQGPHWKSEKKYY